MLYIGTMSTIQLTKINQLLSSHPEGVVLLSSWLKEKGYSLDLQKRYKKSGWLSSLGNGAMIRSGTEVDYLGAVYALQNQAGLTIHPAAKSALLLLGKTHYLELGKSKVVLFGSQHEKLPAWFKSYTWDRPIEYHATAFLPHESGLTRIEVRNFSMLVSNPVRAIMECLYLAPVHVSLLECFELMEGLNALHPDQVQELMESCSSVKVKRLFMYMAEKADHQWVHKLDKSKIDFGSGKRSLVKNGVYIPKYMIMVPKELEGNDQSNL